MNGKGAPGLKLFYRNRGRGRSNANLEKDGKKKFSPRPVSTNEKACEKLRHQSGRKVWEQSCLRGENFQRLIFSPFPLFFQLTFFFA